jgi:hypothetical protein
MAVLGSGGAVKRGRLAGVMYVIESPILRTD